MPQLDVPAAAAQPKTQDARKATHHHRDPTRETVETIVFVAVLVLLLKLFVTEAFVIPTGSMATTLLGIHKIIDCPKCGYRFPVNSHDEVEGNQQNGRKMPLYGFCCPNCRYLGHIKDLPRDPSNRTGDRVLVLKPIYHIRQPERGDVVVFKYPAAPQEKQTAQNYIKRCEGFGDETLAIYRGKLYVTRSLTYPADKLGSDGVPLFPRPDNPLDIWHTRYMYSTVYDTNPDGVALFETSLAHGFSPGKGGFEIVRKGERQLLADRRIVWNNDQQPQELASFHVPSRWYPLDEGKSSWHVDDVQQPKVFAHSGGDLHYIRYRNLIMPWKTDEPDAIDPTPKTDPKELDHQHPVPIDNFLGYNAGRDFDGARAVPRDNSQLDKKWVGDLTLECEATLNGGGEVVMELSKALNRFQARFGNGEVELTMTGRGSEQFKSPKRPCKVSSGKVRLRFANVDSRLWVWVNGSLIDFGDEANYNPVEATVGDGASPEGWVQANDVDAPAGLGAKGDVTFAHIVLYRDIYYTHTDHIGGDTSPYDLFYVQPGCYMCMGDNSAQSSDSRKWGLVPSRLMLGKAVFVFWPYDRIGFIH